MKGLIILAICTAAALIFAACSAKETTSEDSSSTVDTYKQISQQEAAEMMKKEDGHIIVDVRREDEFAESHIPGAICIPNETIDTEMPKELPDKEQIILVYCRSGRRSKEASQKLFDIGYMNVYEFGGIIDWTGEIVYGDESSEEIQDMEPMPIFCIRINDRTFSVSTESNSSTDEFIKKLSADPLTLTMSDYGGFEKNAKLPYELPRNDEDMVTKAGDIILYQGDTLAIYYGENSYSLTKLGHINGDKE